MSAIGGEFKSALRFSQPSTKSNGMSGKNFFQDYMSKKGQSATRKNRVRNSYHSIRIRDKILPNVVVEKEFAVPPPLMPLCHSSQERYREKANAT